MNKSHLIKYFLLSFTVFLFACTSKKSNKESVDTLFTLIPAEHSNINFANTLDETKDVNVLTYQYLYNGGGVSTGDFNGDGLEDIYFSGNWDRNRLYINKGDFKFEDVTEATGTQGKKKAWKTGVTIVDINGDGLLDIYLCYSGTTKENFRTHELFINQGPGKDGVPHFAERAAEYGLNVPSYSTQSAFFDYDRDGDLDMILLNHNPKPFSTLDETSTPAILKKAAPLIAIELFKNDNGKFKNVSESSGLHRSSLSYGLGIAISDINNDGFPDVYLSQDYSAADYLYINNGNGTFTDKTNESISQTSYYSMGSDIADINNDLQPDVFTLDMLPDDNHRQKLLFAPDNYEYTRIRVNLGLHEQYMRNMLHLNNGNGTFSEVGQLSGISNTDWSWAPLFADYDNDGWQDLFISNGYLKDYTNMDFLRFKGDYMSSTDPKVLRESYLDIINKMPASDVINYIFKNNGNLTFTNKTAAWGLTVPSNSNGSAYTDLDNDGDLDLLVNNVNLPAFVYKNNANNSIKNNYIRLKLKGAGLNSLGIGAKAIVYTKNNKQYREQMPTRGFQSSVTPVLHFGLGKETLIDSLRVIWQSGKQQVLTQVKTNQLLTLDEKNASSTYRIPAPAKPLFTEVTSPVSFSHKKSTFNDFKQQPLLINPLSFFGPCLVKGDVNGDGLEDIYAGGGYDQAGGLFIQQQNGSFVKSTQPAFESDKQCDDVDAVFFDADKDGFTDLYVVSGGYGNFTPNHAALKDRLYLNNGKGGFSKSNGALPVLQVSKSCVRVIDINADGNPDLFVGGRVIPGRYPETPQSAILINDGKGRFTDQTAQIAPALARIGMVTDAASIDLNGDKKQDLIVAGEWMPITVFINTTGKLVNQTKNYFSKPAYGWWNKLLVYDLNKDGKQDIVAGNMGLNSQCKASDKEPAEMYYKDFDDNGAVDPILCFYIQGKSFPYVSRDELLDQMSIMRPRFADYKSYADAGINDIFKPEELKGAIKLKANTLKTTVFINNGKGKFEEKPLPLQAQFAPVFTITPLDYNKDGNEDLLIAGNINKARLRFGKYDANYGVLLKGNGKGNFSYIPQQNSGFKLTGDVRGVLNINNNLLFGINQQEIKAYQPSNSHANANN